MPKVSVIIPIYGVEKYIERCAISLFEQTLGDIEYIFVDDCSPDNSISILENTIEKYRLRFSEENKIVRIVRMQSNSGQAAVRLHGLQLATGEYVIHCDSDDWIDILMYEKLYNSCIENNSDISYCDYNIVYPDKTDIYTIGYTDDYFRDILKLKRGHALWNKMVKKDILLNNVIPPKGDMGEDLVYCIQYFYYAKKVSYVNEPLYYYLKNDQSITGQISEEKNLKKFNDVCKNHEIIYDFLRYKISEEEFEHFKTLRIYQEKQFLLPLISNKRNYNLWKKHNSEYNWKILKCVKMSAKEKIKYILRILGFAYK